MFKSYDNNKYDGAYNLIDTNFKTQIVVGGYGEEVETKIIKE